jgi:hypothetical protein
MRGFVHLAGIKESTVDIGEELHEEEGIGEGFGSDFEGL